MGLYCEFSPCVLGFSGLEDPYWRVSKDISGSPRYDKYRGVPQKGTPAFWKPPYLVLCVHIYICVYTSRM